MPDFPATIPIDTLRLDQDRLFARQESIFNRRSQIVRLAGGTADRWTGSIVTPLLSPAQNRELFGFLTAVGPYGDFDLPYVDHVPPASGITGALVLGSGQSGRFLTVDALPASTVGVIRQGDHFQVGTEFKRVIATATSSASGSATIEFWPELRVSPADNEAINFITPKLRCELVAMPTQETDALKLGGATILFQEQL